MRALYEAVPAVHVLRYPVKALLPCTLALAVLAALGADRLLVEGALPRFRRRAAGVLFALGGLLAALAVLGRLFPGRVRDLLLSGWDPAWLSDPRVVLAPIVQRLPGQAALAAAGLIVLALLLLRGIGDPRGGLFLLGATALSLLAGAPRTIPRVPSSLYERPFAARGPRGRARRARLRAGVKGFRRRAPRSRGTRLKRRPPRSRLRAGAAGLGARGRSSRPRLRLGPRPRRKLHDPDALRLRPSSPEKLGAAREVAARGGRALRHRLGRAGGHAGPRARLRGGVRRRARDPLAPDRAPARREAFEPRRGLRARSARR